MSQIAILTDSTAYLTPELVELHNIQVTPLKVHWKGETFRDGIDLTPQAFYTRLKHETELPTTSQPSIQEFIQIYEDLAQKYDGIIAPLISSGISGTVASAQAAAAQFTRVPVKVIDSHTTSTGLALIVLAAARAVTKGKSLNEVAQLTQSAADNMSTFFVVDTLKYLHLGGRIGGASRYLGSALNIKPILYFNDKGMIDALERVRTIQKALNRLAELVKEKANGKPAHIGLIHASAPERVALVKEKLETSLQCEEILTLELSPVIGTHVGPGAIGVAVYADSV
ncbi:MAG: DegV family protein [Anaerolineales bacterium]|nr:DegV family protein [Anaerolineales bacterium]